jgi:hypothetical protein
MAPLMIGDIEGRREHRGIDCWVGADGSRGDCQTSPGTVRLTLITIDIAIANTKCQPYGEYDYYILCLL